MKKFFQTTKFFIIYFLIIDFLFFLPVLLKKSIIGSVDAYYQFYPYILHLYEGLKNFEIPFWWQYTALGYPFVSVTQSGALYPLNYLYLLIPPPLGYNILLMFHFLLLQIFSFLYIRYLLKREDLAFLGAILFSFNIVSKYREIKMENIDLYLYPKKKVLSITRNLEENEVYEQISDNPAIYHNLNSMPNVFSVKKIKTIENIVDFKKMLLLSQFNPSQIAFIEKNELEKLREYLKYSEYNFLRNIDKETEIENINFFESRIEKISFFDQIDKVELNVNCDEPAFIVINNSYYDGWICEINKKKFVY